MPEKYAMRFEKCLIEISGKEAYTMLQGQLGCNVETIPSNQAKLTAICNRQGQVLSTVWVIQSHTTTNSVYLLLPSAQQAQTIYQVLNPFSQLARLNMIISHRSALMTSHEIQIAGNSENIIYQTNHNMRLYITDNNHPIIPECDANTDYQTWIITMIKANTAIIDESNTGKFTPHKIGYLDNGAIDLKKGCFIGQEIIARTEYLSKKTNYIQQYLGPQEKLEQCGQIKVIQQVADKAQCHALIATTHHHIDSIAAHIQSMTN